MHAVALKLSIQSEWGPARVYQQVSVAGVRARDGNTRDHLILGPISGQQLSGPIQIAGITTVKYSLIHPVRKGL